jgi:hypothetical protein
LLRKCVTSEILFRKKNERLSCGQKSADLTREKHKKTHYENQNKVQCLDFAFLAMPVVFIYEAILTVPLFTAKLGVLNLATSFLTI